MALDKIANWSSDVINLKDFKQMDIQLFDSQFFGDAPTAGSLYKDVFPKYIRWTRNEVGNGVKVFSNDSVKAGSKLETSDKKIAWMLESPAMCGDANSFIKTNYKKFHKVVTFDKRLLQISDDFIFSPLGGCWIRESDWGIPVKIKNISTISSAKRQTAGHLLRHDCINSTRRYIDTYGRGYNPVDHKIQALKDYRFSVTIENVKQDYYFSEKLIDCVITGTVPIYWGCPSIGDFFDIRGFIVFNSVDDLINIVPSLTVEKYNSMLPFIKTNLELAKNYAVVEDNLRRALHNII